MESLKVLYQHLPAGIDETYEVSVRIVCLHAKIRNRDLSNM